MGQCASKDLPSNLNHDKNNGNGVMQVDGPSDHVCNSSKPQRSFQKSASWVSGRISKRHRSNKELSATFNILESEIKGKLVNINAATEEELMTLSGVSRPLAHNIVEYRNTIGGFRRLEDLVLVSGVGASVLQNIKNDITIRKISKRNASFESIHSSGSLMSQPSIHSASGSFAGNGSGVKSATSVKPINVNSATIFDFMNIKGMSQEIAANIVHYRSKKGSFKSIDELMKVKGLCHRSLGLLRIYLTCEPLSPKSELENQSTCSVEKCLPSFKISGHRRTYSAPLQTNSNTEPVQCIRPDQLNAHRFSSEFSADLFELLSLRSERPHRYELFTGRHRGKSAVRVATWNLQNLSSEKISNPGVLEVICRTILENGFSIVAVQEVMSTDVLAKICSELNCGSLRRIREWNGPKSNWLWSVSKMPVVRDRVYTEYGAFLYNSIHGVELVSDCVLSAETSNGLKFSGFQPQPYLGYFKVVDMEMVLVNLHVRIRRSQNQKIDEEIEESCEQKENKLEESKDENKSSNGLKISKIQFEIASLKPMIEMLSSKLQNEQFVAYLGSFGVSPDHPALNVLRNASCSPVFSSTEVTDISNSALEGTEAVDHVWLSSRFADLYTGSHGVVRNGLDHMAIPRGWGWGGLVSDHCPAYCDLYTDGSNSACSSRAIDDSNHKGVDKVKR